ncbi:hypothetical protein Taro_030067 [Colocasia esculenta]|uniref:Uncharacterized protein n=1 Tax=Colocasia esculenta TaxID=4460 RepID=A0A843VN04_COLES|nr:hypothetical protein [Colocasia esculenta]
MAVSKKGTRALLALTGICRQSSFTLSTAQAPQCTDSALCVHLLTDENPSVDRRLSTAPRASVDSRHQPEFGKSNGNAVWG